MEKRDQIGPVWLKARGSPADRPHRYSDHSCGLGLLDKHDQSQVPGAAQALILGAQIAALR